MRQNQFNKHGQPFSKKQKKASRMMMKLRKGFSPQAASNDIVMPKIEKEGMVAAIASMFGFKVRRKAA